MGDMTAAVMEFSQIIKHLPEYTVWVLVGILVYKVVIIGGWISVARLIINRTHDYLTGPKEPEQIKIGHILCKVDSDRIAEVLHSIPRGTLNYIHESHIDWLALAIKEKVEREAVKVKS